MKLLFYSPDSSEVEMASRELLQAGVPCEIRTGAKEANPPRKMCGKELWIQNVQDTHRALMLCVQLGVGFGKPPVTWPLEGIQKIQL
jgi:hypothetical protein